MWTACAQGRRLQQSRDIGEKVRQARGERFGGTHGHPLVRSGAEATGGDMVY